jgi:glutathione synthase/RimK-type ligase-like ATP-grasp enzyme
MKRLIILTDENSMFLISKADFKNFTSMDIDSIKSNFIGRGYDVTVHKFSQLDLSKDYKGIYILYQTSEAKGSFYKRYIEDLVYFLEKQGAIVIPNHEILRVHHDKIFMELMRLNFADASLKTLKSICYGSWVDAQNYNSQFPVVIKHSSSSGGKGVFLAKNKKEYSELIKKAGNIVIGSSLQDLLINYYKNCIKKFLTLIDSSKSKYREYDTTPLSIPLIVQPFIEGLGGDYKVLIFGEKYYCMYRKNRDNDFRASGSGRFFEVPEIEHEGLLNFAKKITSEINYPIFGMDIGFDGKDYHLIEFQMIHIGTSALQRSKFWHEFQNGRWIRIEGLSNLEEELSRAISGFIDKTYIKQ